jgi:hypothetical protein
MSILWQCSIASALSFWMMSNSGVRPPHYCNKATLAHNPPQTPLFEAAAIAKEKGAS